MWRIGDEADGVNDQDDVELDPLEGRAHASVRADRVETGPGPPRLKLRASSNECAGRIGWGRSGWRWSVLGGSQQGGRRGRKRRPAVRPSPPDFHLGRERSCFARTLIRLAFRLTSEPVRRDPAVGATVCLTREGAGAWPSSPSETSEPRRPETRRRDGLF